MVHRAVNGKDLWWHQDITGDDKELVEVTLMQPGYSEALATEDLQISARRGNKAAIDHWRTLQKNYQTSVDAGRGDTVTPPEKPAIVIVADPIMWPDGQVTAGVPVTYHWPA